MKKRLFLVGFILAVFVNAVVSLTAPTTTGASDEDSKETVAFQEIRGKLEENRVPFEPLALLEPTWREEVNRVIDDIPEMREKRVLGDQIKGVQLAETLYLSG